MSMKKITVKKGENIKQLCMGSSLHVNFDCGGNKTCRKCKVRIIEGDLPATPLEKKIFTQSELDEKIRLACLHEVAQSDLLIEEWSNDELSNIEVLSDMRIERNINMKNEVKIAIDIGTTTVVMAFFHLNTGTLIHQEAFTNPQIRYGRDVITRIEAVKKYGVHTLRNILNELLEKQIDTFEKRFPSLKITEVLACGNSVMSYLFLGMDPTPLGQAPFTCTLQTIVRKNSSYFFPSLSSEFQVTVLPSISAFVGGDIVAGVIATELLKKKSGVLIDLGTNGELALFANNTLYCTATAAGPAFEGSNMHCGIASVNGAISGAKYDEGSWKIKTINDKAIIGICGSGYMDIIAEGIRANIIEPSGYIEDSIVISEDIEVINEDIRHFQLAKSAIRAGLETLLAFAKCNPDDLDVMFISGGFGSHANLENLVEVGIIPEQLLAKVQVKGNSALLGLSRLIETCDDQIVEEVLSYAQEVELAYNPMFNELFIENMVFKNEIDY